jgi:hypothetical protein
VTRAARCGEDEGPTPQQKRCSAHVESCGKSLFTVH